MNKDLLIYMKNIGKAEEKLSEILQLDILFTLSKHHPDWDSEHEVEAEQLDEARRSLTVIRDKIDDVIQLISGDDMEDYSEN